MRATVSKFSRRWVSMLGTGLLVPLLGCAEIYWAETRLNSDGSLERAVYQPAPSLPSPHGWLFYRAVAKPANAESPWPESEDDLMPPAESADSAQQYVFARGRFPSVDKIPAHFRVTTPDGMRSAELLRDYQRVEYGWYTEHRWEETLTDVVTLTDVRQARQELAHSLSTLVEEILRQAYGDTLDSRQLLQWLRSEGMALCEELSDTFYQTCQLAGGHERWQAALQRVLEKHGVPITLTDEWQDNAERVRKYISDKLHALLRLEDGQPVTPEIVSEITDSLVPPPDSQQPSEGRLQQAAATSIDRLYGDRQAWEKTVQGLLARIVGVHFLASGLRQFRYDLTVPGVIVQTNGVLQQDNRVRWQFPGEAAYPNGYRMMCRCLEPDVTVQQALWGQMRFADRESLVRLHAVLQQDEEIRNKVSSTTRPEDLDNVRQSIRYSDRLSAGQKQWLLGKLRP